MIGNKKVVGVCLTKIHDIRRSDYLHKLRTLCNESDYKMLIFNSYSDFYAKNASNEGAKSVYSIINYDIIDILVVIQSAFHDQSLVDEIISTAQGRDIPVLILNSTAPGCWSICANYEEAYKNILRHVIENHHITDTFYIAGTTVDPDSLTRIRYYKEVLAENGIPFDDSMVGYGEYWEGPVRKIVYNLIQDRGAPPKAIFCANDYMAFAACTELAAHGYKVPEDVIVTGFDGVPASEYFSPQLTTCSEDLEYLSELTVQTIEMALDKNNTPENLTYCYTPVISESCGCFKLSDTSFRNTAMELHSSINDMEIHEEYIYACIDHMLSIDDMNSFYKCLSETIVEGSYVCLNSNFIAAIIDANIEHNKAISNELIVISSKYNYDEADSTAKITIEEMIPYSESWADDNTSFILTAIHVGGNVCGYYAIKTDRISQDKDKFKRSLNAVTIAFNIAINYFRQLKMKLSIETASMTNPVTKLPNFKGLARWFEEFSAIPENRQKVLSFSVYALPKYMYIQDNYGMSDAEEAVIFIGEALKIANPTDCFIAHINEDEFAVVNYYNSHDEVNDTITSATSVFYSVVEGYNSNSGKEYYVEANAGCTVVDANWDDNLESYIKFANGEMYVNRLKYGIGTAVKEEVAPKEHYKAFSLLIEKNLFTYHFQPIVSAKTGEIFAYEALMRTDASIGMNPLEVLAAAKEYNRLYDIEKATMFNIMERYEKERESFGNRRVFINTIPGHFLRENDLKLIREKYGKYMDKFTFELTEQNTVSDTELNVIRKLCGGNNVAIDDYGSGHSNIVNLIRYAPQVIKIDRFLITDIHKNQNKQMFVRTTVEFAKMNNIKVLAEGVETSNELSMVIDLGVDYIQGYYTAKPSFEIVQEIDKDIRREIVKANPLFGQDDN